jgi:prephenate dehydratase
MRSEDPSGSSLARDAGVSDRQARGSGIASKTGYLGPAGTFSEEALLSSAAPDSTEPVAQASIYETMIALRDGELEWAVVPIENSLDGSISVTLDLLAEEAAAVQIVGETLLTIRHSLIAARSVDLGEIETVLTHPQVPGQCARFLRSELPHARVISASSTAEAVREVVEEPHPGRAALGTRLAADIYGGVVLREGVQDRDDNETRFVWLGRAGREASTTTTPCPPVAAAAGGGGQRWKTSLVFWGEGADSPGWLVRCLNEFARRGINLTKIESRPRREQLGHYMFFVDLDGGLQLEPDVSDAIADVREMCEEVRVLGSYPAAS